jgi:putative ABC transport system permease protein
MFKLNLKIAFRNLWKHKTYTFINIAGLSIGMASCILIFIFIRYELSFDDQFLNKDRIFRVVSNWVAADGPGGSQGTPIPLSKALRNDFPQMERVAAVENSNGVISLKNPGQSANMKENVTVYFAQPDFFKILDFDWLSKRPDLESNVPNTVVISEERANTYFGDWHNAIGKVLRFQNNTDLKITGIFKNMPENSSFPLDFIISYSTFPDRNSDNWGSVSSHSECYFMLKKGVDIEGLDRALVQFNNRYNKEVYRNNQNTSAFQSLKDIHYNPLYGNFSGRSMEKKEIYGLSIIGIFLILTACINFINLATAQAVGRSKEVGVRKVLGSGRKQLMIQFLSETLTISVISVLVASVLTEIALPHLQNLFSEHISFSIFEHPVIFVFLAGLVVLVSFLAGFYPAIVISGFNPALAIKNKIATSKAGGGLGLRRALIIFQFSITIILIIATLVVLKQMNYLKEKPLGFNPEAVSLVNVPADSLSILKQENLRSRISGIPGVLNVSLCSISPSSNDISERNFSLNGIENKDFSIRIINSDAHYFNVFGLKLIAGKPLMKSDTTNGYVINQALLSKLHIARSEEALGKILSVGKRKAVIVGVIRDFNDKSLHQAISPIAIFSDRSSYYSMAIKMESKQTVPVMKEVERIWNSTFINDVYSADFVQDELNGYYATERLMSVLFKVFSAVIIFISFIGLFGLISFVALQRTKEIAIRKILGATTFELVTMLNGSFIKMVLVANLVAWPVAYIFISKWLSGFAYRTDAGLSPFVIGMVISMAITLITVSFRSFKTAKINPIDAIKYE